MNSSVLLGSLGVGILLIAFVLNLLRVTRTDSLLYGLLNFTGAGIACMASCMIRFYPFVILEGVWTVLSLVTVIKTVVRLTRQDPESEPVAESAHQ